MLTSGSRTTCKLTPVLFKKKEKERLKSKRNFWMGKETNLLGNRIDNELQNTPNWLR